MDVDARRREREADPLAREARRIRDDLRAGRLCAERVEAAAAAGSKAASLALGREVAPEPGELITGRAPQREPGLDRLTRVLMACRGAARSVLALYLTERLRSWTESRLVAQATPHAASVRALFMLAEEAAFRRGSVDPTLLRHTERQESRLSPAGDTGQPARAAAALAFWVAEVEPPDSVSPTWMRGSLRRHEDMAAELTAWRLMQCNAVFADMGSLVADVVGALLDPGRPGA